MSIYRKYLDLYEENPGKYRVLPEDLKKLYDIYNRDGFNQSYYKVRNGREMIALKMKSRSSEAGGDAATSSCSMRFRKIIWRRSQKSLPAAA